MIKVAIFIPTIGIGGVESMLSQMLKYYDTSKNKIKLFVLGNKVENQIFDNIKKSNVEYEFFNKRKGLSLSTIKKVSKSLGSFNPDVIHTNLNSFLYCIGWAKKNKVKIVHTFHSSVKIENGFLHRIVLKHYLRKQKIVPIAISNVLKTEIVKYYGLKENNVLVVFNPVDLDKFYKKSEKKEYDFISVCRFHPIKNHIFLVKAFEKVVEKNKNVKLAFVGDGETKQKVEEYVNEHELNNNIIFLGKRDDVNDLLNKSKVFVLGSLMEGLPLTILEAMAVGLPIIATSVGGVVDIVKKDNGVLVESGNVEEMAKAFITYLDDKKVKKDGEISEKYSKQYGIKEVVKNYEQIYCNNKN